jgi:nitrogen fixation protein NifU and related proteins
MHGRRRWTRRFRATGSAEEESMSESLDERIAAALRDPQNVGELENADAVGTVGDSECGEMLRMWIKYRQQGARR